MVSVSKEASSVIGTSAELAEGDTLTIKQLMYGLMLPSGNDAAHCLAEYFGEMLKEEQDEKEKSDEQRIKDKDNSSS